MAKKLSKIGQNIQRLMVLADIRTQRDLAKKAELNTVHLHKIMSGKIPKPEPETLKKLADALDCEPQDIDATGQNLVQSPEALDKLILLAGENAILRQKKAELEAQLNSKAEEQIKKLKALWGEQGFETILNCRKADVVVALKVIKSPLLSGVTQTQPQDSKASMQKIKSRKSHSR